MHGAVKQAMEWLAAAAPNPRACKRQWRGESGIAMLACGRFWDVLSVPEELGVLTLDAVLCLTPSPGPVLADAAARRVGFFLSPHPPGNWIGSDIRYLGKGGWITVPAPHRAAGRLRWLVPPDGTGALFVPAAVELAMQQALGTLAAQAGRRRCPMCGTATARP
ncbi:MULTISPECIES: hypothetical protein [Streptomyces]|uniref:hypothetical protein n=1 Tax=Streptomyces TaxID=1883 RepID=UPI0014881FA5|nr:MULTISPECIES: hypothetical protein [Streptomyces]